MCLLYGGGINGLMSAVAQSVHHYQGHVIGVISEALNLDGMVYNRCDELVVTRDLRERKAVMDARSDAFIALPGGFGTLEETPEIITLKQLRYYFFNDRVTKALEHIDTYRPPVIGAKWLTEMEPGNAAASSDNPSPFSR